MEETREKLTEVSRPAVPLVGQRAVSRWINSELEFVERVRDGEAVCPGHKPISKFLARAIRFFDGKVGLDFAETLRCNNPAVNSEAYEAIDTEREHFDTLLNQARKAQVAQGK